MQKDDTQNPSGKASGALSRRFLLRSAAATAALAVPVVAEADEEAALEKLQRLMSEASAALDNYQGGTFSAVIHPSAAERPSSLEKRPATLDEEVDRCVGALKRLLIQMHPDATVTAFRCIREDDQDRSIIFNVRYPRESAGKPHSDLNS
ncbi:hypothetical protein [Rhizobium leguminosarum]|uniref:hypothetical protein n=1 Tax=Rhizobium leguminosarum TaxID=384 RepID=UPI00103D5538|nr:hypothetical protein [Rhizobium leguminosarum]TCA72771.1 hypothetical protein E0H74_36325 [Rhizobium leguminosarum bv. viciae]TCA91097.1 hypothetical protein E0H76_27535 [Rhizobium leguminosarum bv. viciae]